ncbi:hypothetical protein, partial [Staphylococcus haemolyticus]|uniref:hypothetical protein n=1 Tax=Staphylococcus haemolyticus TaxID=1283 RepID=UPI001C92E1EE
MLESLNHINQITTISFFLSLLPIILLLYIPTIIFPHHYPQQPPFLNHIQSNILKFKFLHPLPPTTQNLYHQQQNPITKLQKPPTPRIPHITLHIHLPKQKPQPLPTNHYQLNIIHPTNQPLHHNLIPILKNITQNLTPPTNPLTFPHIQKTPHPKSYPFPR